MDVYYLSNKNKNDPCDHPEQDQYCVQVENKYRIFIFLNNIIKSTLKYTQTIKEKYLNFYKHQRLQYLALISQKKITINADILLQPIMFVNFNNHMKDIEKYLFNGFIPYTINKSSKDDPMVRQNQNDRFDTAQNVEEDIYSSTCSSVGYYKDIPFNCHGRQNTTEDVIKIARMKFVEHKLDAYKLPEWKNSSWFNYNHFLYIYDIKNIHHIDQEIEYLTSMISKLIIIALQKYKYEKIILDKNGACPSFKCIKLWIISYNQSSDSYYYYSKLYTQKILQYIRNKFKIKLFNHNTSFPKLCVLYKHINLNENCDVYSMYQAMIKQQLAS